MAQSAQTIDADLEKSAVRIMNHMNADHADSLLAYAHFYAGDGCASATAAKMVGVTRKGFELDVILADGTKWRVDIPYTSPLESAGQVRKIAVAMHFEAFNGLGIAYKLRHGFYSGAARQAWAHMPRNVRMAGLGVVTGLVAVVAMTCIRKR